MFFGHLLALKSKGIASAIYLLSLGRQATPCPITNQCFSSPPTGPQGAPLTPICSQEIQ